MRGVMKAGSCAAAQGEPRQARKGATVSPPCRAPQGYLAGATGVGNAWKASSTVGCAAPLPKNGEVIGL